MGQLEISDRSLPDFNVVSKLFGICANKKITGTMDQGESLLVMYNDDRRNWDGKNRDIVIIPNTLYIKEKNEIYITRNIELELQYYPDVIEIIAEYFPHVEAFIKTERVFSVNIKPCIKVASKNHHRLEEELHDYHKAIDFMENKENHEFLGTVVLGELIRKLYCGEQDLMDGFLIYRSKFKLFRSIIKEKAEARMLIDKLKENPNVVDVDNFFYGSDGKFYLKILGNIVFYTPKKTTYLKFLDLKYLAILDTLANLLNQKRFGRD